MGEEHHHAEFPSTEDAPKVDIYKYESAFRTEHLHTFDLSYIISLKGQMGKIAKMCQTCHKSTKVYFYT